MINDQFSKSCSDYLEIGNGIEIDKYIMSISLELIKDLREALVLAWLIVN
jgi:hypothetical protein